MATCLAVDLRSKEAMVSFGVTAILAAACIFCAQKCKHSKSARYAWMMGSVLVGAFSPDYIVAVVAFLICAVIIVQAEWYATQDVRQHATARHRK